MTGQSGSQKGTMRRRLVLQASLGMVFCPRLFAAMKQENLRRATEILADNVRAGLLDAAVLYVRHRDQRFGQAFGNASSEDAIFLLASITKPIAIAAVMSLVDQGTLALDDPAQKYIPEFRGEGREGITIRQLMTHVSGLPDQLPENAELRSRHAPLSAFVEGAIRTPLLFPPGSKYSYSSMGILLATEVAQRISGKSIASLVDEVVYRPLEMRHSALGIGRLDPKTFMRCQLEKAAAESGGGDPETQSWDWNSEYWRALGSPWGGAHGSAADVARFLDAFLHPQGTLLRPETAGLMVTNQNPAGFRPRGLGFDLGKGLAGAHVSDRAFGHGGSTGTLCWADPQTDTLCVILTTLPSQAVRPHPRELVSQQIAMARREQP
jgi:CubicO group peptidase (beta-lactamase class C family)